MLALLAVELGIEKEAGHAENAVHGGADFVADVGDEFRLEAGGLDRADFADVGVEAGFVEAFALGIDAVELGDAAGGKHGDDEHAREDDERGGKAGVVELQHETLEGDPTEDEWGDDGGSDEVSRDESPGAVGEDGGDEAFFGTGAEDGDAEHPEPGGGMKRHAGERVKTVEYPGVEEVADRGEQGDEETQQSEAVGQQDPAFPAVEAEEGGAEEQENEGWYSGPCGPWGWRSNAVAGDESAQKSRPGHEGAVLE